MFDRLDAGRQFVGVVTAEQTFVESAGKRVTSGGTKLVSRRPDAANSSSLARSLAASAA